MTPVYVFQERTHVYTCGMLNIGVLLVQFFFVCSFCFYWATFSKSFMKSRAYAYVSFHAAVYKVCLCVHVCVCNHVALHASCIYACV